MVKVHGPHPSFAFLRKVCYNILVTFAVDADSGIRAILIKWR